MDHRLSRSATLAQRLNSNSNRRDTGLSSFPYCLRYSFARDISLLVTVRLEFREVSFPSVVSGPVRHEATEPAGKATSAQAEKKRKAGGGAIPTATRSQIPCLSIDMIAKVASFANHRNTLMNVCAAVGRKDYTKASRCIPFLTN